MSLFKNIFKRKEERIKTYDDFWTWFQTKEQMFYEVVKNKKNIEGNLFNKLSPKLEEIKEGFFYLMGMYDENTAELVFTPDGAIKNIVFVEELVEAAPVLTNWKFTALKPAISVENLRIDMAGYNFTGENMSFYTIEDKDYPDKIDIAIVHADYNEDDKSTITNGVLIFLDNYLGELNAVTMIDNVTVVSKDQARSELVSIPKLKDYLIWREKEFVEKYSGVRYDTESDSYASLEATRRSGRRLFAIVNTALLSWDRKASHPWILQIEIKYDGNDSNGMPDESTYELLNKFEDEIMPELRDFDGYLYIGRQTSDNVREIYFACKDFRKPSKTIYTLMKRYANRLDICYDIYKDKYWQSFERFMPNE